MQASSVLAAHALRDSGQRTNPLFLTFLTFKKWVIISTQIPSKKNENLMSWSRQNLLGKDNKTYLRKSKYKLLDNIIANNFNIY